MAGAPSRGRRLPSRSRRRYRRLRQVGPLQPAEPATTSCSAAAARAGSPTSARSQSAMAEAHIYASTGSAGPAPGRLWRLSMPTRSTSTSGPSIIRRMFLEQKSARDFTFPFGSLLRGRRMHNAMIEQFGDRQIEDLPIRYFCVSSDLGKAKMVVHTHGPLWRAVRASASVPIIGPPLYHENSAYIDGGLFNNLPTDIMKKDVRRSHYRVRHLGRAAACY